MNPSIPLLAPAELPGHVSRGPGPPAPLPEGAPAPPESAVGGFGALVAGLLAPGLAKLPGARALPEDVPRPPGEDSRP